MARKFLYFIVICAVLVIAAMFALRLWSDRLTKIAFVPDAAFVEQAPLETNAYEDPAMWFARPGLGDELVRWQPAFAQAEGETEAAGEAEEPAEAEAPDEEHREPSSRVSPARSAGRARSGRRDTARRRSAPSSPTPERRRRRSTPPIAMSRKPSTSSSKASIRTCRSCSPGTARGRCTSPPC